MAIEHDFDVGHQRFRLVLGGPRRGGDPDWAQSFQVYLFEGGVPHWRVWGGYVRQGTFWLHDYEQVLDDVLRKSALEVEVQRLVAALLAK